MSYRLNEITRHPIAMWLLDSGSPFVEHSGSGLSATASSTPNTSTALVADAGYSSVFTNGCAGKFTSPVFKQGLERRGFALEAWVYPIASGSSQQILSHNGVLDGLWINGTVVNFTTKYLTAADAVCSYDLQSIRAFHVVGVHTETQNQLWVNGVLVATTNITDDQAIDSYVATDGFLYCGSSLSNGPKIAVNAVAIYNTITNDDIVNNFQDGRRVVPQISVPSQIGGIPIGLDYSTGSIYFDHTWAIDDDFNQGGVVNAYVSGERVQPSLDANGLSVAGTWSIAMPLGIFGITSIYGIEVEWSASNVIVSGSIDGVNWTNITNGQLAPGITSGSDPTNKFYQIRVTFVNGLPAGSSYLESLRVVAYKDNTINSDQKRTITLSYPGVSRGDYEPIEYNDRNGVSLGGGSLTIGVDTATDPNSISTLEVWVKDLDGSYVVSAGSNSSTTYKNGQPSSNGQPAVGEWMLLHYVQSSITSSITFSGNVIIGQLALYPTQLTASQVSQVYNSYTGVPILSILDTNTVVVSEPDTPASVYTHDWSIDGAG